MTYYMSCPHCKNQNVAPVDFSITRDGGIECHYCYEISYLHMTKDGVWSLE